MGEMQSESFNGREPALRFEKLKSFSGFEPMLGGNRRLRIDRDLLRVMLNLEDNVRRHAAIEKVQKVGAGRFYGNAMLAVLTPKAGYYQIGRLWKIPYSYEQKLAAMDSLVRLDPENALGGLVVALGNDDSNLQRAAIWLIGQIAGTEPERALLAILDDTRQEIRHAAIQALGHRWHMPQVIRLTNLHGAVVAEAASLLSDGADPRLIPLLAAVLRDRRRGYENHAHAQIAIIRALATLGHQYSQHASNVVSVLRLLLDDPRTSGTVYQASISGLREIGTDEARAVAIVYETSLRSAGAQ